MCGIGLLVRSSQELDPSSDVIANLRTEFEIIGEDGSDLNGSADAGDGNEMINVETFFPSRTAQFGEAELVEALQRRGPDQQGARKFPLDEATEVGIYGAVLHLRGAQLASQPVELDDGSVFSYNGEIFGLRSRADLISSASCNPGALISSAAANASGVHADGAKAIADALENFAKSFFPAQDRDIPASATVSEAATSNASWLASNELSDTVWLRDAINALKNLSEEIGKGAMPVQDRLFDSLLRSLLEQICGPFAFLHYCPARRRAFCMRDILGRRSLCLNVNPCGDLCLANVALGDAAVELACTGAWTLEIGVSPLVDIMHPQDLISAEPRGKKKIRFLPRRLADPFADDSSFMMWQNHGAQAQNASPPIEVYQRIFDTSLRESVRKRVAHHSSVGLLFSGGLDSAVLAVLAAQEMLGPSSATDEAQPTPLQKRLQLINVSFDPETGPDRHTCLLSYRDILAKLRDNYPTIPSAAKFVTVAESRTEETPLAGGEQPVSKESPATELRSTFIKGGGSVSLLVELILIDEKYDQVADEEQYESKKRILDLLGPNNTHMDFNICSCLWRGAAGAVDLNQNSFPGDRTHFLVTPELLGSEGFTRLVNTAHVAEFKRGGDDVKLQKRVAQLDTTFASPDTACFIGNFEEGMLNWFRSGDDSVGEQEHERPSPNVVSASAAPRIETSLYRGQASGNSDHGATDSNHGGPGDFKVLLLGHGADELLGGYARHISAFEQRGLVGLQQELLLDCRRLWTRNLGRDDRVVSDWGREGRHPFLDEHFIQTVVRRLPCFPDKLLLRNFARESLGLAGSAARFEKRAIQFGTRIAKQSNKDKFGSNRRAKGQEKYA